MTIQPRGHLPGRIPPPSRRGSRADLRMQRYRKVIGAAWGRQTTGSHGARGPAYDLPRFARTEVLNPPAHPPESSLSAMTRARRQTLTRILLLFALLLFPLMAIAQNQRTGQGYLFAAVGGVNAESGVTAGGGAGFEKLFYKGLGAGLEVQGYGGNPYGGGVTFSANGSYHFRTSGSSAKMVPFGTAGFSALGSCGDSCGGLTGFNFGGGVNYWITPGRGLRLEFRDHIFKPSDPIHKWEIRVGLAF